LIVITTPVIWIIGISFCHQALCVNF
jgi:hypothetical protein